MAVIGKIRKHSGLLVIVIGVALAAFVLGDISKTQSRTSNTIGEVNGEEITYKEFSYKVEETMQLQKQQQNRQSFSEMESFLIREQIWDNLVSEIILTEEFVKLGLTLSDDKLSISAEELEELLMGSNPHYLVRQYFTNPQTGVFNPNDVRNVLASLDRMDVNARKQYYDFEQNIIKDQINKKYLNLIRKGYYIPESIAQRMAEYNVQTASVELLAKGAASVNINDVGEVTEKELKNYYNKHKEDFKLEEETRSVDYVVFDVVPSVEDRTRITEEVNELFEEFLAAEDPIMFVNSVSDNRYDSTYYKKGDLPVHIATYIEQVDVGNYFKPYLDNETYYMAKYMDMQFRPDSIKASHILIAYDKAARSTNMRTKEEANKLADSILRVVKRNHKKFENMAVEFSDDPSAKTNKGDLGTFADYTMVPQFLNPLIESSVGSTIKVETPFGYHIVYVGGFINIQRKYQLAIIDRAIEPSRKTNQDYYTMASKFAAENTTIEQFNKTANELGLNKRSFSGMKRMTSSVYDLEYPRQIVRWAFDDDTKVESLSKIFEFDNEKYVIAILTGINSEGYKDFETVKGEIEPIVVREKKLDYLLEQIEDINDFNKIGEKLVAIPENADINYNLAVLGTHGREPEVVGEIFGLKAGEIAKLKGERTVYVVKMKELKTEEVTAKLETFKSQLAANFMTKMYQNLVLEALQGVSDIEEQREKFY